MPIPAFYGWLVNKYPKILEAVNTATTPSVEYDNLYLDMYSIIYPCFHPDHPNSSTPTTFDDVFGSIFDYVDMLVSMVKPRKLLYLAIDGVYPRLKLNAERRALFETAMFAEICEAEEDRLRKQFEMEGKQVYPKQESEVSDPNIITPGTEFMRQLSKVLKSYVSSRMACDSLWKDIMVILSDANVPGEGEHKIISFIREQRSFPDYDPNTSHCLYSPDSDLIMLGMATHEPHFSILREYGHAPDLFQEQQQQIAAKQFKLLHIWLLREYLEIDMKIEDPPKNCIIDFERIVDDFIFMCFFVRNGFLPCIPSLDTHEGAIDLLMTVYKKQFSKIGGYLVDINRVREKHAALVELSRVENFILMVGTYEEKIFNTRSKIRDQKLKRLISDYEHSKQEEQNAASCSDLDNESSSHSALLNEKDPSSKNSSLSLILRNTKELEEELHKRIMDKCDLFKSGEFPTDKIKLGNTGYKERYYKEKFYVEGSTDIECKRKEIVQKYTEGMVWLLEYYFSGVPSWSWFYPYLYAPFASDFMGMGQVRVNFAKGVPFLPFDQLLSVLPPRSAHALPKAYAQLMLDEQSRIFDWYPHDFEIDNEGKRFLWQGVFKLPYVDERRLLTETRELMKGLSESEAVRNSVEVDSLFVRCNSKLAEKIRYLSLESNKLDTSMSDGIGGIISLCHEYVEKQPCLGTDNICHNTREDCVLSVDYELHDGGSSHIPLLLWGVNLPPKKIFEFDIKETVLWHERRFESFWGASSIRRRAAIQGNWRSAKSEGSASKFSPNAITQHRSSLSLNPPPEVIYEGAGVGWNSSGRGKTDNSSNMKRIDQMADETTSSLSPSHKQLEDGGGSYPHHQRRSQSETMPFGRGRGRLQPNSSNVNSWKSVSSNNISLRPQWGGGAEDQSRR